VDTSPLDSNCSLRSAKERVDETEGSLTNRIDTRQQAGPVRRAPLLIGAVNSDNVAPPIEECVNIRTRNAGQATILDLEGALKLGDAEEAFRNKVQQLVDSGSTHMAVNLAGVTEMDSSGIGALVRLFTTLKKSGGKCTFFAPTKRVQMLLRMVRLDSILDIVEDEATALTRV
jgi:anti-sigma B factor antagonist